LKPPLVVTLIVPASVAAPSTTSWPNLLRGLVPVSTVANVPDLVCRYVPLIVRTPPVVLGLTVPPLTTAAPTRPCPVSVPPLTRTGIFELSDPPARLVTPRGLGVAEREDHELSAGELDRAGVGEGEQGNGDRLLSPGGDKRAAVSEAVGIWRSAQGERPLPLRVELPRKVTAIGLPLGENASLVPDPLIVAWSDEPMVRLPSTWPPVHKKVPDPVNPPVPVKTALPVSCTVEPEVIGTLGASFTVSPCSNTSVPPPWTTLPWLTLPGRKPRRACCPGQPTRRP
jgi:hypothetical protein